jgi:hypothetical protein
MVSVSMTIVFKMRIVKELYREVEELLIIRRHVWFVAIRGYIVTIQMLENLLAYVAAIHATTKPKVQTRAMMLDR